MLVISPFFAKVPNLVDKMTATANLKPERSQVMDSSKITGCLNKAWEPTPKLKSGRAKVNVFFILVTL